MRRDSNDQRWKETKAEVLKRDQNSCRLCKVLTAKEFILLKKNAGISFRILDPAHYIAVSHEPSLCYEVNNICTLNHYSHSLLDDFRDPIDGHYINDIEVKKWWERILKGNPTQYEFLKKEKLV